MKNTLRFESWRLRVVLGQHGAFKGIANENVLIYWPHGVGDWVFLAYVLPLLPSNNRYWITRFGDDSISIMEGNKYVEPVYLGLKSPHCADGGDFGKGHFGLNLKGATHSVQEMQCPVSLYDVCREKRIGTLLYSPFLETHGTVSYPYHTKARLFLRDMGIHETLIASALHGVLPTSIAFSPADWLMRWILARLQSHLEYGRRKLCLISRIGYTSLGKNWGYLWRQEMPPGKQREAEECRDFIRLMLKHDPNWAFLVLEDRLFTGDDTLHDSETNTVAYARLFSPVEQDGLPFGLVVQCLVKLAHLSIGVPAGPFHLSMARSDLPTIGVWTEHLPHWYDEPKELAIHLVGQNVFEKNLHARPGSSATIGHRVVPSSKRVIEGELAFEYARVVLAEKGA